MMRKLLIINLILLFLFAACDKNPIDSEQYKQMLYIVGGHEPTKKITLNYHEDLVETFITISTSGSKPIDQDVNVKMKIDPSMVTEYNNKFFEEDEQDKHLRMLHTDLVDAPMIDNFSIRAKEGISANLPIQIVTKNLHPDSTYALPIRILSVDNYEVNPDLESVMLTFELINKYSGGYSMVGNNHNITDATENKLQKNKSLKATGVNKLRMFIGEVSEFTDLSENAVELIIHDDNTVGVHAWGTLKNVEGSGKYDPVKKKLTIEYTYHKNGMDYKVDEELLLIAN